MTARRWLLYLALPYHEHIEPRDRQLFLSFSPLLLPSSHGVVTRCLLNLAIEPLLRGAFSFVLDTQVPPRLHLKPQQRRRRSIGPSHFP